MSERLRRLGLGAALGAGTAFVLDPRSGRRRRKLVRDRSAGFVRHAVRNAARLLRGFAASANGVVQRLRHRSEQPRSYDDTTLARKVETKLFRAEGAPKGLVDVSVVGGVVTLRGELPSEDLIADLLQQTRSIQGVRGVESLLHTPGTPAPMHQ